MYLYILLIWQSIFIIPNNDLTPREVDFNRIYANALADIQMKIDALKGQNEFISSKALKLSFSKKTHFAISDSLYAVLNSIPLDKDSVLISEIFPKYLHAIDDFCARYKYNFLLEADKEFINSFPNAKYLEYFIYPDTYTYFEKLHKDFLVYKVLFCKTWSLREQNTTWDKYIKEIKQLPNVNKDTKVNVKKLMEHLIAVNHRNYEDKKLLLEYYFLNINVLDEAMNLYDFLEQIKKNIYSLCSNVPMEYYKNIDRDRLLFSKVPWKYISEFIIP